VRPEEIRLDFESEKAVCRDAEKVLRALEQRRLRVTDPNNFEFRAYLSQLRGRAGIYGVFAGDNLIYVGKTRDAAKRLSDHFVKCSRSTQSKLKEITDLLGSGAEVWVAFVDVPVEIYSAIEEALVRECKTLTLNKRAS
jgi:hypothetical protein